MEEVEQAYPPPFFVTDIRLKPCLGNQKDRSFLDMSSGERQMLFYASTVLYHLQNIDSISNAQRGRIPYNNTLVILEEIELYFHPEYQRQLVDNLIRSIDNCHFKNLEHTHLLVVTHSLFVLSDIPKNNVIFLNNGCQESSKEMDTFGANIHEMLDSSFFLNQSMGQFATKKIQSYIELLYDNETPEKMPRISNIMELKYQIDQIGEPLIRDQLLNRFEEIHFNQEDEPSKIRSIIDMWQNKLKTLEDV